MKGFLSDSGRTRPAAVSGLEGLTHLRIIFPTPRYILAMKCLAARSEDNATDHDDVAFLVRELGLQTVEEVLAIVEQFYPAERIHVRTRYFVSEIISGLAGGEGSDTVEA